MRNFRNFEIWKRAISFTKELYLVTKLFPEQEKFGLISQLRRASVSVASNIAEGASRKSDADFCRFLEIALGSCYELETQLIIAKELSYIDNPMFDELLAEITILEKQINQFIGKLRR
jgi:four helix bundle protein